MLNAVRHVLEKIIEDGIVEARVHQIQLKPWREPPEYSRAHHLIKMRKISVKVWMN